jgi:predicted hydrocarbon binding protein
MAHYLSNANALNNALRQSIKVILTEALKSAGGHLYTSYLFESISDFCSVRLNYTRISLEEDGTITFVGTLVVDGKEESVSTSFDDLGSSHHIVDILDCIEGNPHLRIDL